MGEAWIELARANAPLVVVITPLVGAALTAAVANGRASWIVALAAALAGAALTIDLSLRFLISGAADVSVWRADGAGLFTAMLVATAGALTVLAAGAGKREFQARAAPFAYALMLILMAAWIGASMAEDLIGVFLAIECAWLASTAVVALNGDRDRAALTGALRMLTSGGVAGALMLLGIGLISRGVGTTQISALAEVQILSPGVAGAGVGLFVLGLALKAGAAPFHFWLGAAYGRVGGITALAVGAVGAIGALGVLVRVAGFALAAPALGEGFANALVAIGAFSVAVGSLQAIGARNLRRMAAYAGGAQAGCVILSVALGSPAGFAAALVQLFAMCAAALAMFGGAAAIGGNGALQSLDGLGKRAPLASVALSAGALSLMGAPLTIGFLGRWRMIEAGVSVGWWWAAGAVIAASLAAVFYGGRLIERLYFRKSTLPFEGDGDLWRVLIAPALLIAVAAVAMGLEPSWLLRAADAAAALMSGHTP